ncbi:MAG TPA: transcription elongation factor GreA [Steroidobacteraceae bacterium]|nr:transcription elongation factor GreA [Steroidobacteraceae bacterium]
MSRAFVKEDDGDGTDSLPDRPVSPHRNLVTPAGLGAIEAQVRRWSDALAAARREEDRGGAANAARELRYWSARRRTAELIPPVADPRVVRFGTTVALLRGDGTRAEFRIVGEDEADPADGTVSWMAPLARAVLGRVAGDVVEIQGESAEICSIR